MQPPASSRRRHSASSLHHRSIWVLRRWLRAACRSISSPRSRPGHTILLLRAVQRQHQECGHRPFLSPPRSSSCAVRRQDRGSVSRLQVGRSPSLVPAARRGRPGSDRATARNGRATFSPMRICASTTMSVSARARGRGRSGPATWGSNSISAAPTWLRGWATSARGIGRGVRRTAGRGADAWSRRAQLRRSRFRNR